MSIGAFHRLLLCAAVMASAPVALAQYVAPPATEKFQLDPKQIEPFCNTVAPSKWRDAQTIEGIAIEEERVCNPDNPYTIAAAVKGTNNISMATLMETNLAADAIQVGEDLDHDGDPDVYTIKLEVIELNGRSPDAPGLLVPGFAVAPGVQPAFWVFAPKTRDMSTESFASTKANETLRAPSPVIRVEQGDTIRLLMENTHYFPHTIHLHGVDHPFVAHGHGNDGVGQTSEMDVNPGSTGIYEFTPRHAGTMYYHCHTQPHYHIPMGLQGIFVVEENRPNNWVQTFNVGAGKVRHPSVAIKEQYAQEYDLHYQSVDLDLHNLVQSANDPRLIAYKMNQQYDITDSDDDVYLLNGRAFPFTLRESLLVVEPNQKIKLRILNGHTETLALHMHGHKATITHYDGVEHAPAARITRDVYQITPAQRLDLDLNTTNDGLHSYGEGVWMFHDHVEKAFTTNGQGEGGSISLLVYKKYIKEDGTPISFHGMDLTPYFSKEFWQRKYPVWQNFDEWGSLGLPAGLQAAAEPQPVDTQRIDQAAPRPEGAPAASGSIAIRNLLVGILLGIVGYFAFLKREELAEVSRALTRLFKGWGGGR